MGLYERGYYREQSLDLRPNWDGWTAISTLIAINIGVFVVNFLVSDQITKANQGWLNEHMLVHASDAILPIQWWHAISYAFAHDATNPWHLGLNMLGLFFLGRPVEIRYGRTEFYRIYLVAAVFCGALWLFRHGVMGDVNPKQGALGASGAVLAIEMLFIFNYPNQTIFLFAIPMPAWVLGIILVFTNFVSIQPDANVAFDIHLFGIGFAALYFFLSWNFGFLGNPLGALNRIVKKWTGPKLRVHHPSERGSSELDSVEADRILAKIHDQGKDSLTSRERKFLERYSQAVRTKKQSEL